MIPLPKTFGNGHLTFFRGFLRTPAKIGSIIPSSRFLERRVVEAAAISRSRMVVELGPGTGGTTQAILKALPQKAHLLAIEINAEFADYLRANQDPRLNVYRGSAEHIRLVLKDLNHARPDAVVSGIPFSTMPKTIGSRILHEVWACLAPGGRFVAYQLASRVATLEPDLLGDPRVQFELLNVPPMRVYSWNKPA
jgi:phospholipid N-methyltransferase